MRLNVVQHVRGNQNALKAGLRITFVISMNLTVSSYRNLENPATPNHGPDLWKCYLGPRLHVSRIAWEEESLDDENKLSEQKRQFSS